MSDETPSPTLRERLIVEAEALIQERPETKSYNMEYESSPEWTWRGKAKRLLRQLLDHLADVAGSGEGTGELADSHPPAVPPSALVAGVGVSERPMAGVDDPGANVPPSASPDRAAVERAIEAYDDARFAMFLEMSSGGEEAYALVQTASAAARQALLDLYDKAGGVEGVVIEAEEDMRGMFSWVGYVRVPDDWPIGQRVRVVKVEGKNDG